MIEKVELKQTKLERLFRIIEMSFMFLGLVCIVAQIVETGVYQYGEDATLMIIGLLLFAIGYIGR